MAVKVMMPKGSDTMEEGKVLKWLKQEGDSVVTGDAILEIETDKVNMEVESMGSGVLRKIIVPAGGAAPVGALLAVVGKPDEDISTFLKASAAPAPAAHGPAKAAPAPASATATQVIPATGGTLPPASIPAKRRTYFRIATCEAHGPGFGPGAWRYCRQRPQWQNHSSGY